MYSCPYKGRTAEGATDVWENGTNIFSGFRKQCLFCEMSFCLAGPGDVLRAKPFLRSHYHLGLEPLPGRKVNAFWCFTPFRKETKVPSIFAFSIELFEFLLVARISVVFIAITICLIFFPAFYSWVPFDFVAPHPPPKIPICIVRRPVGAAVCLRGYGSSLSSKTLTGKLSWSSGSGQDDRALWTTDAQEVWPDENKCPAQEETFIAYSKETFIYMGFRKYLSESVYFS